MRACVCVEEEWKSTFIPRLYLLNLSEASRGGFTSPRCSEKDGDSTSDKNRAERDAKMCEDDL